jgi:AraC-like DNA-binding protein
MVRHEQIGLRRVAAHGGFDVLHATYITHSFSRHAHDGFALGVIERGAERFYYRGRTHVAPAGSVVLVDPDEPHDGEAAAAEGWTYRMIYPGGALLQRIAAGLGGDSARRPSFREPVVRDPEVAALLARAHRALVAGEDWLAADSLLLAALSALVERHADMRVNAVGEAQPAAVERARAWLHEHLADEVALEDLAVVAGVSPFHLLRRFRAATGQPPHAYLLRLRLRTARDLLTTGVPPAEVAAACGFADQSHLTRRFKRAFGYTPAAFGLASKNVQDAAAALI